MAMAAPTRLLTVPHQVAHQKRVTTLHVESFLKQALKHEREIISIIKDASQ